MTVGSIYGRFGDLTSLSVQAGNLTVMKYFIWTEPQPSTPSAAIASCLPQARRKLLHTCHNVGGSWQVALFLSWSLPFALYTSAIK